MKNRIKQSSGFIASIIAVAALAVAIIALVMTNVQHERAMDSDRNVEEQLAQRIEQGNSKINGWVYCGREPYPVKISFVLLDEGSAPPARLDVRIVPQDVESLPKDCSFADVFMDVIFRGGEFN